MLSLPWKIKINIFWSIGFLYFYLRQSHFQFSISQIGIWEDHQFLCMTNQKYLEKLNLISGTKLVVSILKYYWLVPKCMDPWKWQNPVRKVGLQSKEDLGWMVADLVPANTLESPIKIYLSSCNLYILYQFKWELYS